jgi:hypothetical protein
MRWKQVCLVVAGVMMWATASEAQRILPDGNELLRQCADALRLIDNGYRSDIAEQGANFGRCVGYISGVLVGHKQAIDDVHNVYKLPIPAAVCLPPLGVPLEQLIRIVVKSLREHPQTLHLPSDWLLVAAVSQVFPCREPGRNYLEEVRQAACDDASPAAAQPTPSGVPRPTAPKGAKGKQW